MKELIKEVKEDKKRLAMLIVPLVPLLVMGFLVISKNAESAEADDSLLVDIERKEVEEYSSKTEAYRDEENKIAEVNKRNEKLSSDDKFFSTWQDESMGYLEKDRDQVDSTDVIGMTIENTTSRPKYSPGRDFGYGGSNHVGDRNDSGENNDESTQQVYGQDPYIPDESVKENDRRDGLMGNFEDRKENLDVKLKHLSAVVHNQNRVVKNGSSVRLRITQEYKIGKFTIPKNHIVTGIASLSSERVLIDISSIRLSNEVIPVNLTVYELDGIRGIYDEELLKYEVANDIADESIKEGETRIELGNFGSISTDGVRKKKDEPRVTIPENHKILLKETR